MFKKLIRFFEKQEAPKDTQKDLNKAVLFILLEVALADQQLLDDEIKQLKQHIIKHGLTTEAQFDQYLKELLKEHDWQLSIQPYTRLINEQYNQQQKIDLLYQCWLVALSDNDLDKHEEHRIRKLSDLLYLSHKDFIQTKLKVTQPNEP